MSGKAAMSDQEEEFVSSSDIYISDSASEKSSDSDESSARS